MARPLVSGGKLISEVGSDVEEDAAAGCPASDLVGRDLLAVGSSRIGEIPPLCSDSSKTVAE